MMNDEHGGPERAGGSGAPDLSGLPDPSGWASFASSGGGTPGGAATTAVPEQPGSGSPGGPPGGSPPTRRKGRSAWVELPVLIIIALIVALLIKTFVIQPFFIPSSSMEDTLLIGDKILVNKLVYDFRPIQPGDIVVFNGVGSWNAAPRPAAPAHNPLVRAYDATLRPLFRSITGLFGTPAGQTDYVKRVIGVPGDHVVCCNAQGLITVNGVALHEQSYLYPGNQPGSHPPGVPGRFNVRVPAGYLWVLGDHRSVSADSRANEADPGNGMIPESKVIGRAFLIVWPPSRWRILPIPSTFEQPGILRPAASHGQAALAPAALAPAGRPSADLTAALFAGVQVRPEAPYVPLAAGLVGALPLTFLERRARQRLLRRLRAGQGRRSRSGGGS